MKRVLVLGFVTTLSLTLIASSHAGGKDDDNNNTVSEYCSSHGDFGLSHGGCVAYFMTHNLVPHNASVCQNMSFQSFLGVANHGQCVKKLGEMAR